MRIAVAGMSDPPRVFGDEDDEVVAAALVELGHTTELVGWDADVDWASYDGVLLRSTWDYTVRLDAFRTWARDVEAVGTPLWNPAAVIDWNVHKGYLLELEERGAPIVPTAWLGRGDTVSLAAVAEDRDWDGVVAKPAVGAGADGLVVVRPGDDPARGEDELATLLLAGDVLVQPYVRSIEDGELSVVVVDGRASHAVRKVPAAGEVRIQVEFGGTYVREELDRDTARLAEWIVDATGHDLLYARVDLLAAEDGSWWLGELEAVEPALLFAWAPERTLPFAQALVARLTDGQSA